MTADRFNDPIYFLNWPNVTKQPILEENGDEKSIAIAGFNWATASYPEKHGIICETKALSQMGLHQCEFNFFHNDVIFGTFSYNEENKKSSSEQNGLSKSDIDCVEVWKCSPFFPVPYFKITRFEVPADDLSFIRIQSNDPDGKSRTNYYFGYEEYKNGTLEIGKWYQLTTAFSYLQFKSKSGKASFKLEFECRRIEYFNNQLGGFSNLIDIAYIICQSL